MSSPREISNANRRQHHDLTSSLFRCLGEILTEDPSILKDKFCKYIESNQNKYEKFKTTPVQPYLESIRNNNLSLGEFEVDILAEMIGKPINLYREDKLVKGTSGVESEINLNWSGDGIFFSSQFYQAEDKKRSRVHGNKNYSRQPRNGYDMSINQNQRDEREQFHFRKDGGRGRGRGKGRDFEQRESEVRFTAGETNFPMLPHGRKDATQMMEELSINDQGEVPNRSSAWAQPRNWKSNSKQKENISNHDLAQLDYQETPPQFDTSSNPNYSPEDYEQSRFQRSVHSGARQAKNFRQPERKTGKVKFFNLAKGYGFVVPDEEGPDVFVHYTAIVSSETGNKTLSEGEIVEYYLTEGPKGLQAAHITGPQNTPVKGSSSFQGHEPLYVDHFMMVPPPMYYAYGYHYPAYPYPRPFYPPSGMNRNYYLQENLDRGSMSKESENH